MFVSILEYYLLCPHFEERIRFAVHRGTYGGYYCPSHSLLNKSSTTKPRKPHPSDGQIGTEKTVF